MKYKVKPETVLVAHDILSSQARDEYSLAYGSFRFVEQLAILQLLYPKKHKKITTEICIDLLRDGKYTHTFDIRANNGDIEERAFYYSRAQVEYLIAFSNYIYYKVLVNAGYDLHIELNNARSITESKLQAFQASIVSKKEQK